MNFSKLRKRIDAGDVSDSALSFLLGCRSECESLDFKEALELTNDASLGAFSQDVLAIANSGGGYLVVGVRDGSWNAVGLPSPLGLDSKQLRDKVRKATGLRVEVDLVEHRRSVGGTVKYFPVVFVRPCQAEDGPLVVAQSYHPHSKWGLRKGDIYLRRGDESVRLGSKEELKALFDSNPGEARLLAQALRGILAIPMVCMILKANVVLGAILLLVGLLTGITWLALLGAGLLVGGLGGWGG